MQKVQSHLQESLECVMALSFARPNGRSIKISMQSIIADIFTVGDTVIIILSAVHSADLCPHDVEDDVDLHRVFESQFNYSVGQKF